MQNASEANFEEKEKNAGICPTRKLAVQKA